MTSSEKSPTQIDRTAIAVALVVLLVTVSVTAYVGLSTTSEDLQEADDDVVTNCDVGPGCGSVELFKIAGVLAVVSVAAGALLNVRRRWSA